MNSLFRKQKIIKDNVLQDLGELYHEYSFFGQKNEQINKYKLNQTTKGPIITAYIAKAIALSKENNPNPSFLELFCADAYFAMIASRLGASKTYGLDNNRANLSSRAEAIASRLSIDLEMIYADINKYKPRKKFDIVANIGGLYHVPNPEEVLDKSYKMAEQYLIVQNVVSLANKSESYFESPAPGWDWGNRYSKQSFEKLMERKKYNIIDYYYNELAGNDRLEDKGCLFYLIKK